MFLCLVHLLIVRLKLLEISVLFLLMRHFQLVIILVGFRFKLKFKIDIIEW